MGFDRLAVVAPGQGREEGGDGGEAADVFVGDAAFEDFFPGGVSIEKGAMVFLEVGVAMPARSEHDLDVSLDPAGGIVISGCLDLIVKLTGELEIGGVFSGFEILVVVNISLPPKAGLVVEDVGFFVEGFELGAPENAVGMVWERLPESVEVGVVPVEGFAIVIPMDRHREGVGDE